MLKEDMTLAGLRDQDTEDRVRWRELIGCGGGFCKGPICHSNRCDVNQGESEIKLRNSQR